MATIANIILSILSFMLAVLSSVFVILTLKQNKKILKQGQAQINESHNQFIESKRLECQPFLQMELVNDLSEHIPQYEINISVDDGCSKYVYSICKIKNVGNGTATNLIYSWKCEEIIDSDVFPVNAIMNSDTYSFQVTLEKKSLTDSFSIEVLWGFEDILGNTYEQKSFLHYEDEVLVCIENDSPNYLGPVKYRLSENS